MCEEKPKCQRAEDPVDDPKGCSPEQIRKCHGDAAEHACCKPKEAE